MPTPVLEPEDEFLILEDDTPEFYIPCKTSNRRRLRQKETKAEHSTTDKDSSPEKGMRDSPQEIVQNDVEPSNSKQGAQSVNEKLKKSKGKKNKVTESETNKAELLEDLPADDLVKKDKPNKKRLKKFPPKKSEKDLRQTDEEIPTENTGKKAAKVSEVKSSKSSKDGKNNAKANRAKSLKRSVEAVNEKNEEICSKKNADAEALGSLSGKDFLTLKLLLCVNRVLFNNSPFSDLVFFYFIFACLSH